VPKLLVIDDDVELHEFIKAALRDFSLSFAECGKDGMRHAQRARPDLILLDLNMPEQNGIEVYGQLRRQTAFKDIPCVIMTAMGDSSGVLESAIIALGAVEFLQKPFTTSDLIETVQHALEGLPRAQKRSQIKKGIVRLDPVFRRVWVGSRLIGHLPPKRFHVLAALAQSEGPVERSKILKDVWGSENDPHTLDKTIQRLREDLGADGGRIVTTPGGYQLVG
jgi:DNA-binding response OmpR family regulator